MQKKLNKRRIIILIIFILFIIICLRYQNYRKEHYKYTVYKTDYLIKQAILELDKCFNSEDDVEANMHLEVGIEIIRTVGLLAYDFQIYYDHCIIDMNNEKRYVNLFHNLFLEQAKALEEAKVTNDFHRD